MVVAYQWKIGGRCINDSISMGLEAKSWNLYEARWMEILTGDAPHEFHKRPLPFAHNYKIDPGRAQNVNWRG